MLRAFLVDLFKGGVPNVRLCLRVMEFGNQLVDRKFGGRELVALDDASRASFLQMADVYSATQSRTDISQAVLEAVAALRTHHADELARNQTDVPLVSHVVCFTDGAANKGVADGKSLLGASQYAMRQMDVFVHYIGLGGSVNSRFMSDATAKGDAGVFAVAADPTKIPAAFEEVFGFALSAKHPLTVEIVDACGKHVLKKGMLTSARSVLVEATIWARAEEGAQDILVRLLAGGRPIAQPRRVSVVYKGEELGEANPKVKELVDAERIEERVHSITQASPDLASASRAIRGLVAAASTAGTYAASALTRASALADEADENEVAYRSLGQNAGALFAARSSSQSQYSR